MNKPKRVTLVINVEKHWEIFFIQVKAVAQRKIEKLLQTVKYHAVLKVPSGVFDHCGLMLAERVPVLLECGIQLQIPANCRG